MNNMDTKEPSLMKLILSLTGITLVAAFALTGVFLLTKEPIENIQIKKNNAAKAAVLQGFDIETGKLVDVKIAPKGLSDSLTVTLAFTDKELFGAAVKTYTNLAFSGRFDIIVGFDKEGNILNTSVLGHHETPGLGDKIDIKKSTFPLQFNGKNPGKNKLLVKKDGGEVDAITSATISSKAFCDAVNNAFLAFQIASIHYNNNAYTSAEKEENND